LKSSDKTNAGASASESAAQSATALLTLRDVHARYDGAARDTVARVSLSLGPREIVCILGPNGCGKTTLLRVLTGALPCARGEALAWGEPVASIDRKSLARRLAVVGQQEESSHDFTVGEVVAMGRAPHQDAWLRERAEDRAVVDDAIARCRVGDLRTRLYRTLSGGEQKRVQIARALAQRPEALLLDEPAAFLDVHEQIALYDLLEREVHEKGMALLVVMHDLNAAAQYADRVVLMKGGEIVSAGTVAEVMTYATLKETFDADLYCGVNEITKARFFLPMRTQQRGSQEETK
jgi:iron complex transport system ATP-binding protein